MKIRNLFSVVLTLCIILSLAACGSAAQAPAETAAPAQTDAPAEPAATEETTVPEETAAPAEEEETEESFEMIETELLNGVSSVQQGSEGSLRVNVSARGMESDVVLEVTLDADGNVSAVELISHAETPELGGAALEGDYLQSYVGADPDAVDAYAGAKYTSEAIKTCLRLAVMQYKAVNGIEFEAPKTVDELVADALVSELGDNFTAVETECAAPVLAVYSSDDAIAVDVEGTGHDAEHPMRLLVVLDKKGTVKNIHVIDHAETPDIGAKALEQNYLCFYYGGKHFTMIDMGDDTRIDVYSGATATSFGVLKLVNAACEAAAELIG